MPKDINQAVREVCLWLPESEEFVSHGAPSFRVRGKVYANYALNVHGDRRIALWLHAPRGSQELHVGSQPQHYFIPPYVGPRGWLGVNLDQGLPWDEIAARVREAYEQVAPPVLQRTLGDTPAIEPPTMTVDPAEFDPLSTPAAQAVLKAMRELCLALPESVEAVSFGSPVWRAGKKTFAGIDDGRAGIRLLFWVGYEMQGILSADPRFTIPEYLGAKGWIALDAGSELDWSEVRGLALQSYRHVASKRMLGKLGEG